MSNSQVASPGQSADTGSHVVIVGGGIGGMASALALTRAGVRVTLLEKASQFGEVGAGLQMGPNASRILREWGLLDELRGLGVSPRNLVFRDAVTAEVLTKVDLGERFEARYGAPYFVIHRSDLHSVLHRTCAEVGVELRNGVAVESVETQGDRAYVHCDGGEIVEADAVLGMDGLNSTLRAQVSDDQPVASGYVAYRGTFPISEVPLKEDLDEVVAWIGPGCHFVQYPLRQGEMLNQVAVFRSPAFLRGEKDWGGPDELDQAYRHCSDKVRSVLGYLWRDRWWPMYDREPIDNWIDGRMLMLGDGAHPMLQYLAQGACQAIEDAQAIGAAASEQVKGDNSGWDRALKQVNAERSPRTARVQRTARLWGDLWHIDGVGREMRNELFRSRDVDSFKYYDWLYGEGA